MSDRSPFQPDGTPGATCPFCGSGETEFFSLFGSQLLTAQYYCRACHTPFEQIKTAEVLADAARRNLARAREPQARMDEPGEAKRPSPEAEGRCEERHGG